MQLTMFQLTVLNRPQGTNGQSSWWIGFEDKSPAQFPSDDVIKQTWDTVCDKSPGLTVLKNGNNHRMVAIPSHLPRKTRKDFITALAAHVSPAPA